MKFPSIATFASALVLTTAVSAADLKIGVVDVARAYKEYYKTKEANEVLKKNAGDAAEKYNDRVTAFKKLLEERDALGKEIMDPVLSEAIKNKKRAEFQRKSAEAESLNKDMGEYRARSNQMLQNEDMQNHQRLYAEILEVVQKKAKADGFDLVFDKSGAGISMMPILLHYKEEITTDFTPELIIELNKNAPAGAAAPGAAEKAEPEKKDTESKELEKKGTEKKATKGKSK